MGNFFSAGAVTKIEIMVRNGDKTHHFTDIRIEPPGGGGENKQLADLMLQLDGPSDKLEIVYFKLSQDHAHIYVPSEEKLIALIGTIDAYRAKIKKGWTAPDGERPKIHINTVIIDVKLDEKSKELAAKMMMIHIALVMAKFNMHCDESSLMGNMVEFKTLFGGLNEMVGLLK
jgi:hypothetical protein